MPESSAGARAPGMRACEAGRQPLCTLATRPKPLKRAATWLEAPHPPHMHAGATHLGRQASKWRQGWLRAALGAQRERASPLAARQPERRSCRSSLCKMQELMSTVSLPCLCQRLEEGSQLVVQLSGEEEGSAALHLCWRRHDVTFSTNQIKSRGILASEQIQDTIQFFHSPTICYTSLHLTT